MNIYLIGFMGTGKSAAGQELSALLKRQFIDLDAYIEAKAGKKIKDIFHFSGEQFFRQIERKVLAEVSEKDGSVIACGGGIVLDPSNIEVMKRTGRIICLTASVDEIVGRTALSRERPLLEGDDPRQRVETLLKQRESLYGCAQARLDTTGLTPRESAQRLGKLIDGI